MRSGIEGSTTEFACSATLMLSCLTREEERTIGEQHELEDDRLRALREAYRIVRPGGVLAAAAISRFASTYDGLLRGFLEDPGFEEISQSDCGKSLGSEERQDHKYFGMRAASCE